MPVVRNDERATDVAKRNGTCDSLSPIRGLDQSLAFDPGACATRLYAVTRTARFGCRRKPATSHLAFQRNAMNRFRCTVKFPGWGS
jgi:hypothetical protein